MSTDLEKARQAVIEAARKYACNPHPRDHWSHIVALYEIHDAVASLNAIERESRPSDGGRMNEDSIGSHQ